MECALRRPSAAKHYSEWVEQNKRTQMWGMGGEIEISLLACPDLFTFQSIAILAKQVNICMQK